MIACLIPARFNSSRFPGKLLARAGGKTVLQRTFESACLYFDPTQIFIATDDERIEAPMRELGAQVIWTSPDCQNGTERIAEAVSKAVELQGAEIILNLQGDHPTTAPETMRAVVEALQSDPNCSMSTAAIRLIAEEDFRSAHVVKVVVDQRGNALYFSRTPIPYCRSGVPACALQHIGLYCFRRKFLLEFKNSPSSALQMDEDLEQLKALEAGHRIKVALVHEAAIGVDTPDDLAKLERFLCR